MKHFNRVFCWKGEKISKGMAIFANRPPSTREIVSSVGLLFKFHPFKSYLTSPYIHPQCEPSALFTDRFMVERQLAPGIL